MPHLERYHREYEEQGLKVLCVCTVSKNEAKDLRYLDGNVWRLSTLDVLYEGEALYQHVSGQQLPLTFLVDRQRRIRFLHGPFREGMEEVVAGEIQWLLE